MSTDLSAQNSAKARSSTGKLPPVDRVEAGFNTYTWWLLNFGALLTGLLAIPICVDIFCRTFLGFAISGLMEVEIMTLVVIAFSCMGYTIVIRAPIQIDILYQSFKGKTQARLDLFAYVLSLAIAGILGYETAKETIHWASVTAVLRLPEKYFFVWTCIGFCSVAVGMLFQVRHSIRELIRNKDYIGMMLAVLAVAALMALPFLYRYSGFKLSGLVIGGVGFALLITLLLIRVPIGLAMALIGLLGLVALKRSPAIAFGAIAPVPFREVASFVFVAMPMFVLMGELTFYSGLSTELFECANKWLGRLPGGLCVATVGGCAGFSAVCGDSLACVVTMSAVALPQMRAKNYDMSLATGALAAGGTLGILIPPSMGFIIYSILTEESVGKLFLAGILPGLLLAGLFMVVVVIQCLRNPALAPKSDIYSLKEKLLSTISLIPVALLFGLVVGGILMGAFTPGEGGAVGAMGAFLYALVRRTISKANLIAACRSTALMCGKLFLIFAGVFIFGLFLASSRLPNLLAQTILALEANRYIVLFVVVMVYIVLGLFMNIIPLMMLTLPSIYPTVMGLGFDGIWFGVITVVLMEMGMITPPVGINVFTLASLAPDIPMSTMFKGVMPFFIAMCVCVIILTLFPQIALYLPHTFL